MATSDKLNYLIETKNAIKNAIAEKGQEISDTDTFRSYADKISAITTGGEPEKTNGKFLVQVIDYDGTVLKKQNLNKGETFILPNAPTKHERLVFQEWSSPVNIVDNTVVVEDQDITIGAVYTTKSGLSEFDIELPKTKSLTVTMSFSGTKDWGDGTVDNLNSHTYSDYGNYMITFDGTSLGNTVTGDFYKNIRLSNKITSIKNFSNCYCLETLTLPNSITSTSGNLIRDCRALKSLILPNNINNPSQQGYNCYRLLNTTIPKDKTSINSYDFYNCRCLEGITIPKNATSIGGNAFEGCSNLTSIAIPSSVTSIGSYAFRGCYSIFEYNFKSHLSIPALENTNAFYDINNLCKIYVPDALYDEWIVATNWATYAKYIYKASDINGVKVPVLASASNFTFNGETVTSYTGTDTHIILPTSYSIDGGEYEDLTFTTFNELYSYSYGTSVTFPLVVTDNSGIEYTFADSYEVYKNGRELSYPVTTSVLIPNYVDGDDYQVTSIVQQCFVDNTIIEEVVIPDNYNNVGYQAFRRCNNLKSVTIPNSITALPNEVFGQCTSLSTVNKNKLLEMGAYLFSSCESLEHFEIDEGVVELKTGVFGNCGIKSIHIPSSVTTINNSAFNKCFNLDEITIAEENPAFEVVNNCLIDPTNSILIVGANKSIIPSDGSVVTIGVNSFSGRSRLQTIEIPDSITTIQGSAFENCIGVTSLKIGSGLTSIGSAFVFAGLTNLETIEVSSSNSKYKSVNNCLIDTSTYTIIRGCNTSTIPSNVVKIGGYAFSNSKIIEAIIPSSVTEIEHQGFKGCSNLINISIPESVTVIGNGAFDGCTALKTLTIPSGVTSIGYSIFKDCRLLTEITILATIPPTLLSTDAISSATTTIYIPAGTLSAYQTATNWSSFADKFVELT